MPVVREKFLQRRNSRGFTLLEVIVALAVVAIAMGALMSSGGNVAQSASMLEEKLFAHWVASNQMVSLRLNPEWPSVGSQTGKTRLAGRQWQWRQKVVTTPEKRIRRVMLEVENTQGVRVTTLTGYISNAGGIGL